jgi:hypothetical protein
LDPQVPAGRENNGAVVHGNKMYLNLGGICALATG